MPINLQPAAPALFELRDHYVIATTPKFALIDAQHPAKAGDVVVLWATGLGPTTPPTPIDSVPRAAAELSDLTKFQVSINGAPLNPRNILYAGLAPGFAGLYQVNLLLPENTPADPEIMLSVGDFRSPTGRKLFLR